MFTKCYILTSKDVKDTCKIKRGEPFEKITEHKIRKQSYFTVENYIGNEVIDSNKIFIQTKM